MVDTENGHLHFDNTLGYPADPIAEYPSRASLSPVDGRTTMSQQVGTVTWVSGPVIRARGSTHVGMLELVEVGEEHLVGEVIGLNANTITIQVYEETSGMRPGAPVYGTGLPFIR